MTLGSRPKLMSWRSAFASFSLLAQLLFGQADDSKKQGLVIGIEGVWSIGRQPLRIGDAVNAQQQVSGVRGALVVWFENARPVVLRCKEQSCVIAVPAPPSPAGVKKPDETQKSASPAAPKDAGTDNATGQIAGIWAEIRRLMIAQPDRYVTAASRGIEGDLSESVALLKGSQVDVAAAFRNLDGATYWVRFQRLTAGAEATQPALATASVPVDWKPGSACQIPSKGLGLGLYRISLLEPSGESTGSEAWMLLTDEQHYRQKADAFQDVAKEVDSWPTESDPSAARAMLRATLQSLAIE